MSWPMVKLADVATVNPRLSKDVDGMQEVSFVAMASASEEGRLVSEEIRVLSETRKGFTNFEKGDVLLAKITPCFENGKCLRPNQIKHKIGFGSTEFHVLRADPEKLDSQYLFYMVWSDRFRWLGESSMSGAAGQKRVSAYFLKGFEIPLPPLPEQKRIAAILDKADAIRRKRQQAIKLADDFLRSVFMDMFGDLSLGKKVKFGSVVCLDAKMVDPREDKYIDLVHIGPDRIEKETGRLLPALTAREENLISKKFIFDKSYVLYSKIRPYLKKCALANSVGLCSADMYPIRPVEGKTTREFVWMLLLSDIFSRYTETLPDRASIPKLNRTELADFELFLPDYEIQKIFSKVVKFAFSVKEKFGNGNASIEALLDGLGQKAFSGQL